MRPLRVMQARGMVAGGGSTHRYWRLRVTAPDGSALYCGFTELQLRGTVGGSDLTNAAGAANVGATASSTDINASNDSYKGFDDSITTGWLSATASTSWIRYDFVAAGTVAQNIAQISITGSWNAPSASPKDFELQWSDDDTSWTTVLTVTGQTGWSGSSDVRVFTV